MAQGAYEQPSSFQFPTASPSHPIMGYYCRMRTQSMLQMKDQADRPVGTSKAKAEKNLKQFSLQPSAFIIQQVPSLTPWSILISHQVRTAWRVRTRIPAADHSEGAYIA